MKDYSTPIIELLILDKVDVLTASVGTENDNNYSDRDDWGI